MSRHVLACAVNVEHSKVNLEPIKRVSTSPFLLSELVTTIALNIPKTEWAYALPKWFIKQDQLFWKDHNTDFDSVRKMWLPELDPETPTVLMTLKHWQGAFRHAKSGAHWLFLVAESLEVSRWAVNSNHNWLPFETTCNVRAKQLTLPSKFLSDAALSVMLEARFQSAITLPKYPNIPKTVTARSSQSV